MAAIHHPLGRAGSQGASRGSRWSLQVNWWVLSALVILGASAMLPVVQTSSATTTGFDIETLQTQRARLASEVGVIEAEVAELRSLDRIERRALEMGLVPAEDPIYVTIGEPGPGRAQLPDRFVPEIAEDQPASRPWWRPFVDWLPFSSD